MHTASTHWICDYCGKEKSSGADRPMNWPAIEMRYTNGRYGGWLCDFDLCDECWDVVRGNREPAKAKCKEIFRKIFGLWKNENQ